MKTNYSGVVTVLEFLTLIQHKKIEIFDTVFDTTGKSERIIVVVRFF